MENSFKITKNIYLFIFTINGIKIYIDINMLFFYSKNHNELIMTCPKLGGSSFKYLAKRKNLKLIKTSNDEKYLPLNSFNFEDYNNVYCTFREPEKKILSAYYNKLCRKNEIYLFFIKMYNNSVLKTQENITFEKFNIFFQNKIKNKSKKIKSYFSASRILLFYHLYKIESKNIIPSINEFFTILNKIYKSKEDFKYLDHHFAPISLQLQRNGIDPKKVSFLNIKNLDDFFKDKQFPCIKQNKTSYNSKNMQTDIEKIKNMSANVLNEQNLFIESDKLLSKDQRDIIYQIFEDDYKILKNDQKLYKFYK